MKTRLITLFVAITIISTVAFLSYTMEQAKERRQLKAKIVEEFAYQLKVVEQGDIFQFKDRSRHIVLSTSPVAVRLQGAVGTKTYDVIQLADLVIKITHKTDTRDYEDESSRLAEEAISNNAEVQP